MGKFLRKAWFMLFTFVIPFGVTGQSYVTWNTVNAASSISGTTTLPDGTIVNVTIQVTTAATGNYYRSANQNTILYSSATDQAIIPTAAYTPMNAAGITNRLQMFRTNALSDARPNILTFTVTTNNGKPVKVSRFLAGDIDARSANLGCNGAPVPSWDDSFAMNNITFNSPYTWDTGGDTYSPAPTITNNSISFPYQTVVTADVSAGYPFLTLNNSSAISSGTSFSLNFSGEEYLASSSCSIRNASASNLVTFFAMSFELACTTPAAPTGAGTAQTICSGETVSLSGSCSTGSLQWYSDSGLTSPLGSTQVSPTATTTYYAACVNQTCVSPSVAKTITVNAKPAAPTTLQASPSTICAGQSSTLSAQCSSGTLTWYTDVNLTTSTSATVSPTSTRTYYAACVSAAGCKSSAGQTTVTVNTTPTTPTSLLASPATICAGQSSTLSAQCTTGTLTWYSNASLTINTSAIVSPTSTSTYYAVCQANGCSSPAAQVTVNVNPLPSPPTSAQASASTICSGSTSSLTASCTGSTLQWYSDAALTVPVSATVSPTATSTYYAACISAAGCRSTGVAVTVTVNTTPSSPTNVIASPTTICQGSSSSLSGSCVNGSLLWYAESNLTTAVTGTVSPSSTTTYYAVCRNTTTNCTSATTAVTITVNPKPGAPTNVAASPGVICSGSSTTLSGNCSSGSLLWYADSNLTNAVSTTVSPSSTTTYYAVCRNTTTNCTSATTAVTVTVNSVPGSPTSLAASANPICEGESVTLTGSCSTGTIQWYSDSGLTNPISSTITPTNTATYYAVCQANSCKSTSNSLSITVNPRPAAPTNLQGSASSVCSGQAVNLTATCPAGTTVKWYTNASLSNETSASVSPTSTTTYYAVCQNTTTGCKSLSNTIQIQAVQASTVPVPVSLTASPATLCAGQSSTLSGSCSSGLLVWYTDASLTATLPSTTVTPTTTTSYYAVCVVNGCAGASNSVQVTVNEVSQPTGAGASPSTFCAGGATTLAGSCTKGILTWFSDNTLTTQLSSSTVSPTTSTTYYAACVNGVCKSTSVSVNVVVNPAPGAPVLSTPANTSICQGTSLTLAASCSNSTLKWYTDALLTNETNNVVTPTGSTTYYAACVSAQGCKSATATVAVTVNPTPPAPVTVTASPATICQGGSSSLSASCSNGSLLWYSDAALTVALTTTTVSPSTTTTYYAVCKATTGCSSSSVSVELQVNSRPATPTSLQASPATVCNGQTTTLSGSCATGTLSWYTDAALTQVTGSTPVVLATTTYYAICTNTQTSCKSSAGQLTVVSTGACNVPPVATNDIAITPQDKPVTGNVLTNDNDPDGTVLTVTSTPVTPPAKGTVTINSNGTYTYTPSLGATGTDTFCYEVKDAAGAADTACVVIEIISNPTAASDAPVAVNDNASTPKNTPVTIPVLSNDQDPDGRTTLGLPTPVSAPSNGTVTYNPDGTVTYTPETGFTGTDTFVYQVCDNGSPTKCDQATVTVLVTEPAAGNAPPVTVDDAALTSVNTPVAGNVSTNDYDPNGGSLTFTKIDGPSNGTVTLNPDGTYTYTPNTGFVGSDTFTYLACDSGSPQACDKATVTIAVLPPRSKVALKASVWLQGALFGITDPAGIMRDDLRAAGLLPLSQPYTAIGFIELSPTQTTTTAVMNVTGTKAVVDWVFVELRDAADKTSIRDSRAALVLRDGSIVETDGVSPVTFSKVVDGSYFVVVRHRNHLGVMTASAVALTSTSATTVDFRLPATATYRLDPNNVNDVPQVDVLQGVALWAGNSLLDNKVVYQGSANDVNIVYNVVATSPNNVLQSAFFRVRAYSPGDVNMNGDVLFQGSGNDVEYIYLNVVKNHPGNVLKQNFYIIKEQLPQ